MAKKYYAVREGKKIGVFETWAECEGQVKGYSGARYKKFSSYDEAVDFINASEDLSEEKDLSKLKDEEMVAYVDGSYHKEDKYYSYGAVLFTAEGKETYADKENYEDMVGMRNVAGEIRGAMYAMKRALEMGKNSLYLYYDYLGIEKWAIGEWKTNKIGTKKYKEYYDSIKGDLKVEFKKVKAHSGDEFNDEADRLAKEVLGIEV